MNEMSDAAVMPETSRQSSSETSAGRVWPPLQVGKIVLLVTICYYSSIDLSPTEGTFPRQTHVEAGFKVC